MKIMFVYEHFFAPFDEGIKNLAEMIHRSLAEDNDVDIVRHISSLPDFLNNLLMLPRLLIRCAFLRPDRLVYIPYSSLTFSSFLRIYILQIVLRDSLIVIGTQRKKLAPWQKRTVAILGLNRMFALSVAMAADLERMNIQADILPIGIDVERYRPAKDKLRLREKYGIEAERRVLLHVGHIRESRNIEWMMEVSTALPALQIVLVGSTSTARDDALSRRLEQAGILVFKDYLASIEEVYQLADVYCFPVVLADAAMETPLSILEAMATNLPIVTTAFGRLPEQFAEDDYFEYIASPSDIVESLTNGFDDNCNNREKIKPYTWKATADRLLIGG